jgi:hypothetical protein
MLIKALFTVSNHVSLCYCHRIGLTVLSSIGKNEQPCPKGYKENG